jgi:carotenoid cleavage dioxygenase
MKEGRTLMDSLVWRPELGTRLLIVSRETGEAVATVPVGERYCLHTINAWEDSAGRVVLDLVELDRPVYDQYEVIPDLFPSVGPGRPVRLIVDVEKSELVERRELGPTEAPDFPAIDPRRFGHPTEDLWILDIAAAGRPGRKFFDRLVHITVNGRTEHWQAPPGTYLGGEPAFAPDPASHHGAVICEQLDAEKNQSAFLVFDAFDIAAGPRAILPLESPLHLGFHAMFAGAVPG